MSSSDFRLRPFARTAGAFVLLGALGACTMQAGMVGTEPGFGEATAENSALQRGEAGAMEELSRDFRTSVPDTVNFAFDVATLDASARQILDQQAAWLNRHAEARMTITGHTDLVGSERYNYGLGLGRAKTTVDYLVMKGVSRDRLIAVESWGEAEPIVPVSGPERQNRRAVTAVTGLSARAEGTGLDGVYARRIYNAYQQGELRATEAKSNVSN